MTAAGPLLVEAAARLGAAGVPSPRVDAELLLAHVLGVPRSRLLLVDVDAADRAAYEAALARRVAREPLQHIVGRAPFRHLLVPVGPGVFVPRPETELLVDAVLPALRDPAAVAVDLCSGSGALALALADESPAGRIVAVERLGATFDRWLVPNTAGTRVQAVAADVTDPGLLPDLRGAVDVVVSNPPYVPAGTPVAAEVRVDPAVAVFAGPDGLAVIPHVLARAAELLRPGGRLAIEHDDTHGEAVPALLRSDGRWREVAAGRDLAGRPRYATAVRA